MQNWLVSLEVYMCGHKGIIIPYCKHFLILEIFGWHEWGTTIYIYTTHCQYVCQHVWYIWLKMSYDLSLNPRVYVFTVQLEVEWVNITMLHACISSKLTLGHLFFYMCFYHVTLVLVKVDHCNWYANSLNNILVWLNDYLIITVTN